MIMLKMKIKRIVYSNLLQQVLKLLMIIKIVGNQLNNSKLIIQATIYHLEMHNPPLIILHINPDLKHRDYWF